MAKYIDQAALENALSAGTVAQLFADDFNNGQVNTAAIADVIEQAEGEVDSYLTGEYDLTLIVDADRLLRRSALDYAVCFSFERHPEYVRTFGDNPRGDPRFVRATERMKRIQAAIQRPPDQTSKPANLGGDVSGTDPNCGFALRPPFFSGGSMGDW